MTVPIKLSCSFHEKKEKTKQVNDFNASRTGKFLSMAEVEQTQAIAQGQAEGAEMGYLMQHNGGKQGYLAVAGVGAGMGSALNKQSTAAQAQNMGLGVANRQGIDAAMQATSTAQMLDKLGVTDGAGNMDSKKFNAYVDAMSDEGAITKETALKLKQRFGQLNVDSRSSAQKTQTAVNTRVQNTLGENPQVRVAVADNRRKNAEYDQLLKEGYTPSQIGRIEGMTKGMDAKTFENTISILGKNNVQEIRNAKDLGEKVHIASEIASFKQANPKLTKGMSNQAVYSLIKANEGVKTAANDTATQKVNTQYDTKTQAVAKEKPVVDSIETPKAQGNTFLNEQISEEERHQAKPMSKEEVSEKANEKLRRANSKDLRRIANEKRKIKSLKAKIEKNNGNMFSDLDESQQAIFQRHVQAYNQAKTPEQKEKVLRDLAKFRVADSPEAAKIMIDSQNEINKSEQKIKTLQKRVNSSIEAQKR